MFEGRCKAGIKLRELCVGVWTCKTQLLARFALALAMVNSGCLSEHITQQLYFIESTASSYRGAVLFLAVQPQRVTFIHWQGNCDKAYGRSLEEGAISCG
eukprot:5144773-Amphidinium_carterae.1